MSNDIDYQNPNTIRPVIAPASVPTDALFCARASLKLAARQRLDAQAMYERLRELVDRLEGEAKVAAVHAAIDVA